MTMTPARMHPKKMSTQVGGVWSPEDYLVSLCQAAALEQGSHFSGLFPKAGVAPAQVSEYGLYQERVAGSVLLGRRTEEFN